MSTSLDLDVNWSLDNVVLFLFFKFASTLNDQGVSLNIFLKKKERKKNDKWYYATVKYCLLNSHEIWIIKVIWYRKPKSPQISPRRKFLIIPDVVHFPLVLHKEKKNWWVMKSVNSRSLCRQSGGCLFAVNFATVVVSLYFLKWYSNRKKTLNKH